MPEKLPEHTDQIEDFYKSAFSEDTETPSSELWGKVAVKLESIPTAINTYNWKNGLIRLSVEAILILSLAYYITRSESNAPNLVVPEQTQTQKPLSENPTTIEQELPLNNPQPEASPKSIHKSNIGTNPPKENNEKVPEVIKDEIVEKPSEIEKEEIIAIPEEAPIEEAIKKEVPVVNEKQDLYSNLKKKHITDSSKSLFIEKKK